MRRPRRWILGACLVALLPLGCGSEPTSFPFEPEKDKRFDGMKEAMKKAYQSKSYRNPNKAQAAPK